jgi:hypothetical protein
MADRISTTQGTTSRFPTYTRPGLMGVGNIGSSIYNFNQGNFGAGLSGLNSAYGYMQQAFPQTFPQNNMVAGMSNRLPFPQSREAIGNTVNKYGGGALNTLNLASNLQSGNYLPAIGNAQQLTALGQNAGYINDTTKAIQNFSGLKPVDYNSGGKVTSGYAPYVAAPISAYGAYQGFKQGDYFGGGLSAANTYQSGRAIASSFPASTAGSATLSVASTGTAAANTGTTAGTAAANTGTASSVSTGASTVSNVSSAGASTGSTTAGATALGGGASPAGNVLAGSTALGDVIPVVGGLYALYNTIDNWGTGGAEGRAMGTSNGAAMGTAILPGVGTAIGAVVGFGLGSIKTGKSSSQAKRDAYRESFNKAGILQRADELKLDEIKVNNMSDDERTNSPGDNVFIQLADGSYYNVGADGKNKAKYNNTEKEGIYAYQVDKDNQLDKTTDYAFLPLRFIMGKGSAKYSTEKELNDMFGYFTNASTSNLDTRDFNEQTYQKATENVRAIYSKMGIESKEQVQGYLGELLTNKDITQEEHDKALEASEVAFGDFSRASSPEKIDVPLAKRDKKGYYVDEKGERLPDQKRPVTDREDKVKPLSDKQLEAEKKKNPNFEDKIANDPGVDVSKSNLLDSFNRVEKGESLVKDGESYMDIVHSLDIYRNSLESRGIDVDTDETVIKARELINKYKGTKKSNSRGNVPLKE